MLRLICEFRCCLQSRYWLALIFYFLLIWLKFWVVFFIWHFILFRTFLNVFCRNHFFKYISRLFFINKYYWLGSTLQNVFNILQESKKLEYRNCLAEQFSFIFYILQIIVIKAGQGGDLPFFYQSNVAIVILI